MCYLTLRLTMLTIVTKLVALLLAILLAGCAAQQANRDGKDLVAQGKVEEGLSNSRKR